MNAALSRSADPSSIHSILALVLLVLALAMEASFLMGFIGADTGVAVSACATSPR